jgi:PPE-repeat protein
MYVGAGSGPMLAAAAAWDELAAELHSTAASYGSTVQSLTVGPWTGPSAITMAAAAAPYVQWMSATGAQAELAATQAKLAAGAYEAAFAATVPPPIITANRTLLASLIATNILGQNTPAIATTEAHYMEMWAQDAAAMYAYAGSSATASQLTPFTDPPPTTNESSSQLQAAAAAQSSTMSGTNTVAQLSQVSPAAAPAATSPITLPPVPPALTEWNNIFSTIASGPYSLQGLTSIPGGPFLSFGQAYAWGQNGQSAAAYLSGPKFIKGALEPLTRVPSAVHPMLSSAVTGSMGKSALVGSMSVPQGWTEAAPNIRMLAQALPTNMAAAPAASLIGEEGVFSQMGLSSLAGRAVAATSTHSVSGSAATAARLGGIVAEADPAAATIIVIPFVED